MHLIKMQKVKNKNMNIFMWFRIIIIIYMKFEPCLLFYLSENQVFDTK